RRELVVGEGQARLLQIQIADQPGDAGLLVVMLTVILIGGRMDRLAAVPLRRAFLCTEDEGVILEKPLDARVPEEHQARWSVDEVRGEASEVLAHDGQRAWRRRSLGLAIEVLV